MAKDNTSEQTQETTQETTTPTIDVSSVSEKDTLVSVVPKVNFHATFGATKYVFVKGKEQNVPQWVKEHLIKQNALNVN